MFASNRLHRRDSRAFTLVELMVTVAIIAILAAIAVPNLLEAQTRSRVSRVLSDFRTLQVAVEAYAVDQGRPPRMTMAEPPFSDTYTGMGYAREPISGTLGPWITTPVAYLTRFDLLDPFVAHHREVPLDYQFYTFNDLETLQTYSRRPPSKISPPFLRAFSREFGAYVLMSLGPDGAGWIASEEYWVQYDPTNGTRSTGNIWRSQRTFESVLVRMEPDTRRSNRRPRG